MILFLFGVVIIITSIMNKNGIIRYDKDW